MTQQLRAYDDVVEPGCNFGFGGPLTGIGDLRFTLEGYVVNAP